MHGTGADGHGERLPAPGARQDLVHAEVGQELRRAAGHDFGGVHLPLGEHPVAFALQPDTGVGDGQAVQ
ncbi:hypothetical protein ACFUJU_14620 [Streptomyces sp. NPDC057235]|uniref:hypothetical protein n=1 Tax=Streptomyces sp. NPDC057235 TaxID=3346058 RepID=UPI0036366AA0